jgi:hypothetical protein
VQLAANPAERLYLVRNTEMLSRWDWSRNELRIESPLVGTGDLRTEGLRSKTDLSGAPECKGLRFVRAL